MSSQTKSIQKTTTTKSSGGLESTRRPQNGSSSKTLPAVADKAPHPSTSSSSNITKSIQKSNINVAAGMDSPELENRILRKAEAVIQWRTSRLIVVIERCTNDHNYSAILRTAEALGIQHVWMIDPPPIEDNDEIVDPETNGIDHTETTPAVVLPPPSSATGGGVTNQAITRTPQEQQKRAMHHLFAQNALDWLTVREFSSSEACVQALKEQDYQVWVTDLSQEAECLDMDPKSYCAKVLPHVKVALVMGTEAVGCSQYILNAADLRVYLPLRGFADSLNLSVATALIVHQLFLLDPTLIGDISLEDKAQLRTKWFTKLCQQRLLTSRQKKQRASILLKIRQVQWIQDKVMQNPLYVLQPGEQYKIDHLSTYQQQLQELEAFMDPAIAQVAVQEWIDTPPEPLADLRRADLHRVCFVGKSTKAKHLDHWKDMVATKNIQSAQGVTAELFRDKVKEKATTTTPNPRWDETTAATTPVIMQAPPKLFSLKVE
jgi:tRNA G18 (ribose-2'-O)-methylase SpoU